MRILVLALAISTTASAQTNLNGGSAAIAGYDVVAYFEDGRAVRGSAEHSAEHGGATWWFASEAHRAHFVAAPERYVPAYGGYCAYAMSQGRAVRIDPRAFSVVRGRLYLNYSLEIRERWNGDRDGYIERADREWPRVSRSLAR